MGEEIAISLNNVSKCFKRYARPVDRLKEILLPSKSYAQEFWALRDISFDVMKGETMGIIGRNGAGKSTLLQMICGTLTPTSGEVQVRGRVAALLELGAGFNPEFTGRENVYMNGAIMGLSKADVDEHFDQVAAFADIKDFLDQPVKTYSSGMYVRLAFASAIHVDPDILIVDEALAVGDMFFQAKCMSRMRQMVDSGVTVLFVSHDIIAVKSLCQSCVWIENGKQRATGIAESITAKYSQDWVDTMNNTNSFTNHTNSSTQSGGTRKNDAPVERKCAKFCMPPLPSDTDLFRAGNGWAKFQGVDILDSYGNPLKNYCYFNQTVNIKTHIQFYEDVTGIAIGYHIRNKQGQQILGNDSFSSDTDIYTKKWLRGEQITISFTTKLPLIHGIYSLNLLISSFKDISTFSDTFFIDWIENSYVFEMRIKHPIPVFDFVHLENKVLYEFI